LPKLSVEVRVVVGVHAALESLRIGGSIEEPRGDAQCANAIASLPRGADLIGLAVHVTGSMTLKCHELRLVECESVLVYSFDWCG
jgi:hypothetical protein